MWVSDCTAQGRREAAVSRDGVWLLCAASCSRVPLLVAGQGSRPREPTPASTAPQPLQSRGFTRAVLAQTPRAPELFGTSRETVAPRLELGWFCWDGWPSMPQHGCSALCRSVLHPQRVPAMSQSPRIWQRSAAGRRGLSLTSPHHILGQMDGLGELRLGKHKGVWLG